MGSEGQSFLVITAAITYAFAHFLRSVRFWLLLQNAELSLRQTFATFQISNSLGSVISAVIAEILRVVTLIRLAGAKSLIPVISITLFCRLLDFIVASSPILINAYLNPSYAVNQSGLLAFAVVGATLVFICCSRQALSFVKKVIVIRGRTQFHLHVIRVMTEIETQFYGFLNQPFSTITFNFLLTLLIWSLDVLAVTQLSLYLGSPNASLWEHAYMWSAHAYGRFFGLNTLGLPLQNVMYYLNVPQFVLAPLLLILAFFAYRQTKEVWKWTNP